MNKYANKFEEAIDNCPYDNDFYQYGQNILSIINQFYSETTIFRALITESISSVYFQVIIFELYDTMYLWAVGYEDNKVEHMQLDKFYDYNKDVAFVLYSHIANAEPIAPHFMKMIEAGLLKIDPRLAHMNK